MKKYIIIMTVFLALLFPYSSNLHAGGTLAGSEIKSGGDEGEIGEADIFGDTVSKYNSAGAARHGTCPPLVLEVGQIYGLKSNSPADKFVTPGGTAYYAYQVTNLGNGVDTFTLSYSPPPQGWTAILYVDENSNGIHEPDENRVTNSTGNLAPDETYSFFLAVTAPADATSGDSATVTLTVEGSTSDGDSYQGDNDVLYGGTDRVSDGTVTTCSAAVLYLSKKATVRNPSGYGGSNVNVPGSTITFTIIYDNDGGDAATDVVIVEKLPEYVVYVPNSVEISPHTGTFTVSFDDGSGSWRLPGNTNPELVQRIKFSFPSPVEATDGDPIGSAENENPNQNDSDAGVIRYRVYIK
jgi:uncharacterized repeat protein (TIGR01451 family)